MKKALIGAGGSAKDIKAHMRENLLCFVDDIYWNDHMENVKPISLFDPNEYEVLITVGDSLNRMRIADRLPDNTKYFSFIHPSCQIMDPNIEIGDGSFISANCIC